MVPSAPSFKVPADPADKQRGRGIVASGGPALQFFVSNVRHVVALVGTIVVTLILAVSPAGAATATAGAACAHATAATGTVSAATIRRATVCLINRERRARGRRGLRSSATLTRAAQLHAQDMVARGYFSHVSPAGSTFADRIRRAGYTSAGPLAAASENIAWDATPMTPVQTVRAWMASKPHRTNILSRAFRHIGLGVVLGAPRGPRTGATYAVTFARRG
jgi:uncharacterized protein YkwD